MPSLPDEFFAAPSCTRRDSGGPGIAPFSPTGRTADTSISLLHHFESRQHSGKDLPSHKVAGIREAIEAAGAELRYLPPYSPDLNPIEQFFAKLKALLRKAAARTIDALFAAIADALTAVSPQECQNYLANQGYRH
jgi:transposase